MSAINHPLIAYMGGATAIVRPSLLGNPPVATHPPLYGGVLRLEWLGTVHSKVWAKWSSIEPRSGRRPQTKTVDHEMGLANALPNSLSAH